MIFPKSEHIVNVKEGTAEFEWCAVAQRLPERICGNQLAIGRLLVCLGIEFATSNMLADPTNDARGSLQIELKCNGPRKLISSF
jgi:hypothetical protein